MFSVSPCETSVPSAEAPVSQACNVLTETSPHDQARRLEHLRHACGTRSNCCAGEYAAYGGAPHETGSGRTGTTLGAEITEDDDGLLALLEGATLDGCDEIIFGVEGAGFSSEGKALLARDLRDGAARREVALEDAVPPRRMRTGVWGKVRRTASMRTRTRMKW